jgi:hypothetical protein
MLSGHSAAQEIKHLWKFTSGFIEPRILNFEGSLSLSLGSQSSLVLPCKIFLRGPGNVDNDLQSDCHSDLDSCAPEVMVPGSRVFSSIKNEQKYPWLYDSVVHQGYLCKFCELFCGHSSSSQEFVTVDINLGTVWSLFYYWASTLINLLLFSSFPNSHHLRANFPNYKG